MAISLTTQDIQELRKYYPKLNSCMKRKVVWGTLDFACSYDIVEKEIVWDDSASDFISDSYEIRIDFDRFDTFGFPIVNEDSGIIKNFAIDNHCELEDFHINKNDDDSCCLGIFPEYQWQGTSAFIRDKVVPFFYWQSCRRIFGKEPWASYPHGLEGIKKAMAMPPEFSSKGSYRNEKCPCGSGKKYKKCCMNRDAILKKMLNSELPRRAK